MLGHSLNGSITKGTFEQHVPTTFLFSTQVLAPLTVWSLSTSLDAAMSIITPALHLASGLNYIIVVDNEIPESPTGCG